MKLNSKSISARYYKWFYDSSILPNNLCSYFWSLLFAYSYSSVFFPFLIVTRIFEKCIKDETEKFYIKTFIGLFLSLILFLIISTMLAISLLWTGFPKNDDNIFDAMRVTGFIIWIVILTGSILYFIRKLILKIITKEKIQKTNIICEFIKAKKKRYCPMIDWQN